VKTRSTGGKARKKTLWRFSAVPRHFSKLFYKSYLYFAMELLHLRFMEPSSLPACADICGAAPTKNLALESPGIYCV